MDQQRLFRLAVENGSITFRHEPGKGWALSVWLRRGDESLWDVQCDTYEGLSTAELLDTILVSLDTSL